MLAEYIKLPEEGERLGSYLLERRLSVSILGAFYQAENAAGGERCLVHVLSKALVKADAKFEARYREIVNRMSSRGTAVLGPKALVREEGYLLVVYPVGDYVSLDDFILERSDDVSEAEIVDWLSTLGTALRNVSELGIGHYFLTPGFLFFDSLGKLQLAGLGLFQSIEYNRFESFVSGAILPIREQKEGVFSGIEILSPEIRNYKARDTRSDFYCLGLCAYFFMTKKKPARRWVLPVDLRPGTDPRWNGFISRCLEPSPTDRFADFDAYLSALASLASPEEEPPAGRRARLERRLLSTLPTPGRLWGKPLRILRLLLLGLFGGLTIWTASMFLLIIFADLEDDPGPLPRIVRPSVNETLPSGGEVTVESPVVERLALYSVQVEAVSGSVLEAISEAHPNLHIGVVNEDGLFESGERFEAGTYQLVARHPSYETAFSGEIQIPLKGPLVFEQTPLPAALRVLSEPPGAEVRLADQVVGLTPLYLEDLVPGNELTVRLDLEGYRSVTGRFRTKPGEISVVDVGELERLMALLRLELRMEEEGQLPELKEFKIEVDGAPVDWPDEGVLPVGLGSHELKISHPNFVPIEEVVDLEEADKEVLLSVDLEPLPAGIMAKLPDGAKARFRVDGVFVEPNQSGLVPIPVGRAVEVEAIIENYYSVTQRFEVTKPERLEWTVPLKPLPGPSLEADYDPPYFDLPLVWIEAGRFTMGSPVTEYRRLPNEDNRTVVRFSSGYWMGAREVSQEVWEKVMGTNPSVFDERSHPVDSVSWEQAREFCERLTEFEREAGRLPKGFVYRLPTEAEWEYAARAGSAAPFSFGEKARPEDGNFVGYYSPDEKELDGFKERYGSMPTASFTPNAWGLYDVHGNVAEWTLDRYWDRLPGGAQTDPVNLSKGRGQVIRGGGWTQAAHLCRSSARQELARTSVRNWVGFRVALAPEIQN